jgi:hypothetical protein
MRLSFSGDSQGTVDYTVNGVAVSKAIRRQVFGPAVSCTSTNASREAATNYQDLWSHPTEVGWGLNLAHHGDTIFAALYDYAQDGRDMWLFASSLPRQADGSFTGALYRASGPPFNASPWTPITPTQVGTMTLRFASGTTGTLSYSVNGTSVVKPVRRFVFGALPPLCR